MTDGPADDGPADDGTGPVPGEQSGHDESGLDLARTIARSLARGPAARGPRRRSAGRGEPPAAGGRAGSRRGDPVLSGAHPDERDPQPLDSTLGRLVAEQGWGTDIRVHGVFSRWDAIVGRDVAAHARPVSFEAAEEGGRLVVQADSTAWATQMRLLAATVVRRLNEELGEATVALIDVRGPAAPSWSRGRRSVRGGRGPRDTYG